MSPQSEQNPTFGYIVSTWPRLSQTFVLSEILALERRGVSLRIFSAKDPGGEPIHADVGHVRAEVVYLSLERHWKSAFCANLRLVRKLPRTYCRTLVGAIRHHRWGVIRRFFQACYLADMLLREPVAHLHAHFATAATQIAMFTRELTGIPYTFTAHAKDIYVDTPAKLLRGEMQSAEAVVTISEYNRRYLSDQLGPASNGKVRCIYNGLDLRQFKFRQPSASNYAPPVILSIGRLIEKKGFGDLIATADMLRHRGHRFQIEIIGTGPLRRTLKAQVKRLGLENHVKFFGAQPQEMVRSAFDRATAFALPCVIAADGDRDGIPTVLLEAMASGTPVVSTNVSGIPELIDSGRDGLLVVPNNPQLLADALDHLLTDSLLRDRLAQAARSKIEERFTIDRSCSQLLAVFRNGGHQ